MKTTTIIPNGSTDEVTLPLVKRSAFVLAIEVGIAKAILCSPLSADQIAALRKVGQTASAATTGDFEPLDERVSKGCPWTTAFGEYCSRGPICAFAKGFDRSILPGRTTDFVIE